jgi:hypothetical protein
MSRTSVRLDSVLRMGVLASALVVSGSAVAQTSVENDDCQNAIPITDGTYQGKTLGASVDGTAGCGLGTGPDVWYRYTATCDGFLHVDTCGSDPFDTNLSVQEPDCSGVERACNEDACGPYWAPYQSRVRTAVVAGEGYLIRVSGYNGDSGPFELHVSCASTESPWESGADHCEDAVELGVPTIVRGSTEGADYDPEADKNIPGFPQSLGNWDCGRYGHFGGDQRLPTHGVWYRVAGTGNRITVSVDNPSTVSLTSVLVYCDGCDRPICVVGRGHDQATWCSRAGQTYLIWVVSRDYWSAGDCELSVTDDGTRCYGAVDCTPVEVIDTYLSDNGDDDGWADTNETIHMRFTVANRSTRDVTGLVARLSTTDASVAGIGEREVYVGPLAAGETKLAPGAFTFRVADVDRAGPQENLSAVLQVGFASDQFEDLDPSRCSVTGIECGDHGDCTGSEYCANTRCSISGLPCFWHRDCFVDIGDWCTGRCAVSGRPCWGPTGSGFPSEAYCDDELDFCVDESQRFELDLDLDAAGGSETTEFFESFESAGPSAFEELNLDAELHSPEASEGYRCQYSLDYETVSGQPCFPGASQAHADAYYWQVDDSRAFSGLRSLYMGLEYEPGGYTTPVNNLEAAAITEPINLGALACSGNGGVACAGDEDCAPGERCLAVVPELSFKHQISLIDDRRAHTGGGASASHGVVQVQIVDANGDSTWETIEPKLNRYDSVPTPWFINCFYDPVDDGSTEHDLFDYIGTDPPVATIGMRYLPIGGWYVEPLTGSGEPLGPSSICFPRHVFASAGDTDEPFHPDNLNGPVVGPGLQGELGLGTWVEPVFSLDRFRGRRVRLRFLTSSIWFGYQETFSEFVGGPFDDGWWIDDVRVTHTLLEPATVTADTKDNSHLAADADGDFVADNVDCMPSGAQTWALPGEVLDLYLTHGGGVGGTTTLSWARATTLGATAVDYVVIAEEGSACSESNVGESHSATDSVTPASGVLRKFLIQAANGCGRGPLGTNSLHDPRTGCN